MTSTDWDFHWLRLLLNDVYWLILIRRLMIDTKWDVYSLTATFTGWEAYILKLSLTVTSTEWHFYVWNSRRLQLLWYISVLLYSPKGLNISVRSQKCDTSVYSAQCTPSHFSQLVLYNWCLNCWRGCIIVRLHAFVSCCWTAP